MSTLKIRSEGGGRTYGVIANAAIVCLVRRRIDVFHAMLRTPNPLRRTPASPATVCQKP